MPELLLIAAISWLAGLASFVGGLLAHTEGTAESGFKARLIHWVSGFGGGILMAAVAFALLPEAMDELASWVLFATFCIGGALVCVVDRAIAKTGGHLGQFLAMLLDFVPEALAFGAVFGRGGGDGLLLAMFIGAQNLPEGFNAFRESSGSGVPVKKALSMLFVVSFLGPIAACGGHLFLSARPVITAMIMAAASGGILYLVFQDIAPQTTMKRHWTPPLGAVLGFAVGMLGQQLFG
jgi:ZIP family zinc transporter